MAAEEDTQGAAPCEEAEGVGQVVEVAAGRSRAEVEEAGGEGKTGWAEVAWWR